MRLIEDAHPERGYVYRSDHFSFATAGVPSASIAAGSDVIGRPPEWGLDAEFRSGTQADRRVSERAMALSRATR